MKRIGFMVCGLLLIFGFAVPSNANVFFFDGFEVSWEGDYAPGWINAEYRHGDPPVGKMMQQVTPSYSGNYGLKFMADSVPENWMWWAAVEVEKLPHYAMKKKYNPYVSVWYYDELGVTKAGQVYAVPDWQVDEDWTDVQFGARNSVTDNYYFVTADIPSLGWQDTEVPRTEDWHNLKFQLDSADGYIHFYINDVFVGKSTRNDYTNLGTAIGLYTNFDTPLSDWGDDKPYTLWDDFKVGSEAPLQTRLNLGNVDLDQWDNQNFPEIWDLTKCDLILSYTIDLSGQETGDWTPVQVGLRELGYPNLDPNEHGGWMQANWQYPATDPDVADLDDHFLLVNHGWDSDELNYDVDKNYDIVPPFGSYDSYAFYFDRDGVDEWQADYWNYTNGITYNTNGIYDVVIEYRYNESVGRVTMMATINGESQGFYLDGYSSTDPPSKSPVGRSFTADDLTKMQVFLGRGSGGGTVAISGITVTGCYKHRYRWERHGNLGNVVD